MSVLAAEDSVLSYGEKVRSNESHTLFESALADQALGQELWTGSLGDKHQHILDLDEQLLSTSWDAAEPSFLSDQLSTSQCTGNAESECHFGSVTTQKYSSSTDGQVQYVQCHFTFLSIKLNTVYQAQVLLGSQKKNSPLSLRPMQRSIHVSV